MRTLFVAENDGMAEIDDSLWRAREPYEVLARIRWARARGTLDESKVELFERMHGLRVRRDRRNWHICLMIAIDRGDCLREHGAIDWAAVKAWLGPCPDGKRRRGAPTTPPGKKRLLAEAVEILKRRGRIQSERCMLHRGRRRSVYASRPEPRAHDRGGLARVRMRQACRRREAFVSDGMLRLEGEPSDAPEIEARQGRDAARRLGSQEPGARARPRGRHTRL